MSTPSPLPTRSAISLYTSSPTVAASLLPLLSRLPALAKTRCLLVTRRTNYPGISTVTHRSIQPTNYTAIRRRTAAMASAAVTATTEEGNFEGDLPSRNVPVQISGLKELVETGKYEAWILDQFGVLHDGKKAYPQAIEALRQLAASGAKVVLLSNSSRRVEVASKKLPTLGFDPSLFCGIVTSGEITHRHLMDRSLDPLFQTLGLKCLHFTWAARGAVSLEGLGLQVVETPEEADLILAHGTEAVGVAEADKPARPASLDELAGLMRRAAEEGRRRGRMIPMVVANPDIVTVEARALRVMPGTLAREYEAMGGLVKCMGKPDPISFRAAQQLTGIRLDRTIMVGDSLHHDILGAASLGIDCVFVAGGIHADQLGVPPPLAAAAPGEEEGEEGNVHSRVEMEGGGGVDVGKLSELLEETGAEPSYVLPYFQWQ